MNLKSLGNPKELMLLAFRAASGMGYFNTAFDGLNDSAGKMRESLTEFVADLRAMYDESDSQQEFQVWFDEYMQGCIARAFERSPAALSELTMVCLRCLLLMETMRPDDLNAAVKDLEGALASPRYRVFLELFEVLQRILGMFKAELAGELQKDQT